MAWDTEGTKRRIMQAATTEFAQHGPDGTTVERIARRAGVNKERVYNYFEGKRTLFATVLRDELANVARAVPVTSFATEDIGEYAGRVYDYHRERPELIRLADKNDVYEPISGEISGNVFGVATVARSEDGYSFHFDYGSIVEL